MTTPRDCPCFSGLRYLACCAPLHRGGRAASPEALMRSRYAAFALGLGAYLVATLAAEHPDRSAEEAIVRELARVRARQRFLGLTILSASEEGDLGEVLFVARIFERGKSCGFAELSAFRRETEGWCYVSGVLVPDSELPPDRAALTKPRFLALASSTNVPPSSDLSARARERQGPGWRVG